MGGGIVSLEKVRVDGLAEEIADQLRASDNSVCRLTANVANVADWRIAARATGRRMDIHIRTGIFAAMRQGLGGRGVTIESPGPPTAVPGGPSPSVSGGVYLRCVRRSVPRSSGSWRKSGPAGSRNDTRQPGRSPPVLWSGWEGQGNPIAEGDTRLQGNQKRGACRVHRGADLVSGLEGD